MPLRIIPFYQVTLLFFGVTLASVVFTPPAAAQTPDAMRLWTSEQGQAVKARFQQLRGATVVLVDPDGKELVFPVTRLSRADRIHAFHAQNSKGPKATLPVVLWDELTDGDRALIPSLHQEEFGRDDDCLPNSIANFVVWWHDMGVLPIETTRESFVSALHKSDRGRLHMDERYSIVVDPIPLNRADPLATLKTLEAACRGGDGVWLRVGVKRRSGHFTPNGHAVSLVRLDAQRRTISFNTWGRKFDGTLVRSFPRANNHQVDGFYIHITAPPRPT